MSGSTIAPPTHCSENIWKFPFMTSAYIVANSYERTSRSMPTRAQILLDDGRLQACLLDARDLEREMQARQRTVAVRILVASFVEQLARAVGIVVELEDVGLVGPSLRGMSPVAGRARPRRR